MINKTLESVVSILEAQQIKGLNKYGKTVDDAHLTDLEWIKHTQEELCDALIYLEKLKGELCKQ